MPLHANSVATLIKSLYHESLGSDPGSEQSAYAHFACPSMRSVVAKHRQDPLGDSRDRMVAVGRPMEARGKRTVFA